MTSTTTRRPHLVAASVALALLATLSACTSSSPAGGAGTTITVTASDTACDVSPASAPAGTLTFEVTNTGTKENEFYLLSDNGDKVVGEVEGIGPGLTRQLVVDAAGGSYVTACKPGQTGDGIRGTFTVTTGEPSSNSSLSD